ncbi:MAG: hypothetical protein ACXWBS_07215, partial [Chthoniobacterales bacterium]
VGKKENHLPVDLVTQEGNFLTINSQATGLSYEGRLKNDQIEGTLMQGPLEIALTLKRSK